MPFSRKHRPAVSRTRGSGSARASRITSAYGRESCRHPDRHRIARRRMSGSGSLRITCASRGRTRARRPHQVPARLASVRSPPGDLLWTLLPAATGALLAALPAPPPKPRPTSLPWPTLSEDGLRTRDGRAGRPVPLAQDPARLQELASLLLRRADDPYYVGQELVRQS